MWVITPRGFFSVVQKDPERPNRLTVRARCRSDLENLGTLFEAAPPIEEHTGTDYPYRVVLAREDWEYAIMRMTAEVVYPNFKDEVKRVQGPQRASVYGEIWSILLQLEETWKRRRRNGLGVGRNWL